MKPVVAFAAISNSGLLLMKEEKRMKVKKGWLAVRVGLDDEDGGFRRFTIPISHLYHPQFSQLLEQAQEVYGFHTAGSLRLPCSVDDFLHLRWMIEREMTDHGQDAHRQHNYHLSRSFSFQSC